MGSSSPHSAPISRQPSGTQTPPCRRISPSKDRTRTPPPAPISAHYAFPQNKLKRRLTQPNKTPLVLVACGSFSPITSLHIQMFEMTGRFVEDTHFEVVGMYLSPVSDAYKKPSLVRAKHRVDMCALAAQGTEIMIDPWETLRLNQAGEPFYTRTVDVLQHFDYEINDAVGGIEAVDGTMKSARVVLLIGADVAMTMSDSKCWSPLDLDVILGEYGAFIVERPHQTDIDQALTPLKQYEHIWVVNSSDNDVSSTKIRAQLRNGDNVQDLPELVIDYIRKHDLYQDKPAKCITCVIL